MLIDGLQLRLLGFHLGHLCAYSLLVAVLLVAPLVLELRAGGASSVDSRQAAVQLLYLHARILPAFLVALCVLGVRGVFFSHRIAGPLFRFKQVFRRVREGEIPGEVRLRQGDYLEEEARELNSMLASLRGRLREIHEQLEVTGRSWHELEKALESGGAEDIEHRLLGLKGELDALGHRVGRFEIGGVAHAGAPDPDLLDDLPPVRPRSPSRSVSPRP